MAKRIKVIMDFDGTLTDEGRQAKQLATIARRMLAKDILHVSLREIEKAYEKIRKKILACPHRFHWEVNGLPATYAYEGAYLLNTAIMQEIVRSKPTYLSAVKKLFPSDGLDPVTRCTNHLFHKGTFQVRPYFLGGVRRLLISLIKHPAIDPVIMTNSETRKIKKNLRKLRIGQCGTKHHFCHELEILGDTRQYHMDSNWNQVFQHHIHGPIQVLPVNKRFSVDLRRPVYFEALRRIIEQGDNEAVVVADGFSLAGALPLCMGLRFILKKTDFTPAWTEEYVASHPNGTVVGELGELQRHLLSLVE